MVAEVARLPAVPMMRRHSGEFRYHEQAFQRKFVMLKTLRLFVVAFAMICQAQAALAQDSSLLRSGPPPSPTPNQLGARPLTLAEVSLLHTPPEPVKTLELHDIVTVVVNLNSQLQSDGQVTNRKRANFDAVLKNWVKFEGFSLKPDLQLDGSPEVQTNVNNQFRVQSNLKTLNTLTFTVAAEVVDVRPNGTLVIEARKQVDVNDEHWERWLTGVIRREDVTPDNKVMSEDVANLRVYNRETGAVRDSYKRGWIHKLFDRFLPL
jgi:flagellar L-ring protein precursor FlgH